MNKAANTRSRVGAESKVSLALVWFVDQAVLVIGKWVLENGIAKWNALGNQWLQVGIPMSSHGLS